MNARHAYGYQYEFMIGDRVRFIDSQGQIHHGTVKQTASFTLAGNSDSISAKMVNVDNEVFTHLVADENLEYA